MIANKKSNRNYILFSNPEGSTFYCDVSDKWAQSAQIYKPKFSVYKCFSSHFPLQKPPGPGWNREAKMVGRANVWKKPGVRDDLTVTGTPKLFVWKHGSSWVKLSLSGRSVGGLHTFQGILDEIWLLKNAIGAKLGICCTPLKCRISQLFFSVRYRNIRGFASIALIEW